MLNQPLKPLGKKGKNAQKSNEIPCNEKKQGFFFSMLNPWVSRERRENAKKKGNSLQKKGNPKKQGEEDQGKLLIFGPRRRSLGLPHCCPLFLDLHLLLLLSQPLFMLSQQLLHLSQLLRGLRALNQASIPLPKNHRTRIPCCC